MNCYRVINAYQYLFRITNNFMLLFSIFHMPHNKDIVISKFSGMMIYQARKDLVGHLKIIQFYICVIREYRLIGKENALSLKGLLILPDGRWLL